MEAIILAIGAKTCCIMSSGVGGAANVLTNKQWNWTGLRDIVLAVLVGWIAATHNETFCTRYSMGTSNCICCRLLWN